MGYGLLFIGYAATFLMSLNSYGFLFKMLGSLLMACGLKKLCQFETKYNPAYICAWGMCAVALAEGMIFIASDHVAFPEGLSGYLSMSFYIPALLFHWGFYNATKSLSADVGLDGISVKCLRNGVFTGIVALLALLSFAAHSLRWEIINYIFGTTLIGFFLVILFNLILIYSCYKNICEEGDEENPSKPSRIGFLNKLFEVSEKRQNEIYEKTKSYAENKIRRDNEKKQQKKNRKGKK